MHLLWLLTSLLLFGQTSANTARPLKPQVEYGTYIGGRDKDVTNSLAVDSSGNVWVVGSTPSPDFPVTAGAFKTRTSVNNDDSVGFVSRLSASGERFVYSTFIGGSFRSATNSVAVDSSGNAVVVGSTCSDDFPVTANAIQRKFGGGLHGVEPCDGYAAKLDASGSRAIYATYFGASDGDSVNAVAINDQGETVIAGWTRSPELFGTKGHGESDGFVALLGVQGELKWMRRVGGSGAEWFTSVAMASDGTIWAAGISDSTDLPCSGRVTSGPFGFLAGWKSGHDLGCLQFAGEPAGLSLDRRGNVYVAGSVRERKRTTGFALKLRDRQIAWYRRVGGSDETKISGISAGMEGSVFLCGSSYSRDFPVTPGAIARYPGGGSDMVLLRLSGSDGRVLYGTFLGGNVEADIAPMNNTAVAVHADAHGDVWIVGNAIGRPQWITPNAVQAQSHGNTDAFVLKMRFRN